MPPCASIQTRQEEEEGVGEGKEEQSWGRRGTIILLPADHIVRLDWVFARKGVRVLCTVHLQIADPSLRMKHEAAAQPTTHSY